MIRFTATACLAAMLSFSPAAAEIPAEYRAPGKDWIKGPVKWLLTKDEVKEFKSLADDGARASFVEKFWAQRDPTPDTPTNEYEIEFWQRVEQAEQSFTSQTTHGALDDRGRVLILLGPPTTTDRDARQYQTWTYEPGKAPGIEERLLIEFAPGQAGKFLLLGKKDLESYVDAHPATRGIGWVPPALAQEAPALAGVDEPDPGQELSPESQRQIAILEEYLGEGSGPHDVPFDLAYDFYKTVDGSTLAVINLEVPRDAAHGSGDAALLPFARLQPGGADGKPVNLTGDLPFVAAPADSCPPGSFIYQARRNVRPGEYRIAAVVEDKVVARQRGVKIEPLTVPDYTDAAFEMSSVSLLANIQPLDAGVGPGDEAQAAGPFVLGSFRLVPRAVPVLGRDEALSFYYQVYNPATDPATGRPNLEATYSFFLKEGGTWKPFRKPIQKAQGQVELYSIDVKDLLRPNQPLPAEFRMEARLNDKIAGAELTRQLEFTVR
jgi:GWxTD domain-containing protein